MYLVVGLGNPEKRYDHTRHNIGFETIDALADEWNISLNQEKFKGVYGTGIVEGEKVMLLKPQTYMNLSGESVGAFVRYFNLDPKSELLVIFDDISLEPGQIRIRRKGSAGGHNGIKSLIAHLGTMDFPRIKIGVGAKPDFMDLADWVLGKFIGSEQKLMKEAIDKSVQAARLIVRDEMSQAMNQFN